MDGSYLPRRALFLEYAGVENLLRYPSSERKFHVEHSQFD